MKDYIVCFQVYTRDYSRIVSSGSAVITVANPREQLSEALDQLKLMAITNLDVSPDRYFTVVSSICPA